jgi:hypothetical protein
VQMKGVLNREIYRGNSENKLTNTCGNC